MQIKLVTLTAAALALLVGCTPNPDAPPPGVTPVPAASLPRVGAAAQSPEPTATSPTDTPLVEVTQAAFTCRALSEYENVRVRDLALGLIGAAAVDIDPNLALVAVGLADGEARTFLFDLDSPRRRIAPVSAQWDGVGYGVRLINHAAAVAQVASCATSPDAPTQR